MIFPLKGSNPIFSCKTRFIFPQMFKILKRTFIRGTVQDLEIMPSAIEKQLKLGKPLRIQIDSGGCHGFQYHFLPTTVINDDDFVFEDSKFIVDQISMDLIRGSKLEYKRELIGSQFQVLNPNAESSCGCKISFNIKS